MSEPNLEQDVDRRLARLEEALARLEEQEVVRHLRERYCLYVDAKRWSDLLGLLVPDYQHYSTNEPAAPAVLVASSAQAFVERLARITEGATTVHLCAMPTIVLSGRGKATGHWAMTDVVSHPDRVQMRFSGRGHYDDTYVRGEDGIWRIAVTRLTRQRVDALPLREPTAPAASLP